MNALAGLLTALRDVTFAAAQDQPRNRQGHFGSRIEDGASGIGAGSAVSAEHGAQIAAARRFQAQRDRIENWLRGSRDPAWGSDADNRAMVEKLDGLIRRNQLPGPLAVYVAYDGGDLSKLLGPDGQITDRAYLYGSRQQSIARAGAPAGAYVARVLAPAGMDAYLFPEVSDPSQGVLLPRGLTVTASAANAALRTITASVEMRAGTKLADLISAVRDVSWLDGPDDEARDDQGRWTGGGGAARAAVEPIRLSDGSQASRLSWTKVVLHQSGASGADTAKIHDAVRGLPHAHLKAMGNVQVHVSATVPDAAGLTTRFDAMDGDPAKGHSMVQLGPAADIPKIGVRAVLSPESVAAHEMGHALNYAHGERLEVGMADALAKDFKGKRMSIGAPYFTSHDSEAFAETYSLAYAPTGGSGQFFYTMPRSEAVGGFKNALKQMHTNLKAEGIDVPHITPRKGA